MLRALVRFQIARLRKRFLANITFMRLLARMRKHVLFQFSRTRKFFLANITFMRLLA